MKREEQKPIMIVGAGVKGIKEEVIGLELIKRLSQKVWPRYVEFKLVDLSSEYFDASIFNHEYLIVVLAAHNDQAIGSIKHIKSVLDKPYYWTKCSYEKNLIILLNKLKASVQKPVVDFVLISIGREDDKVILDAGFVDDFMENISEDVSELVFEYLAVPHLV